VSILVGARLIVEQFPKTREDIEDMACVPYASVVGSLMYAMVFTQLDISHGVGVLSRYMSTLGKGGLENCQESIRYLCGTKYYVICYQRKHRGDNELDVHGFFDANWVGDMDR
jgi:hypothetical protein